MLAQERGRRRKAAVPQLGVGEWGLAAAGDLGGRGTSQCLRTEGARALEMPSRREPGPGPAPRTVVHRESQEGRRRRWTAESAERRMR